MRHLGPVIRSQSTAVLGTHTHFYQQSKAVFLKEKSGEKNSISRFVHLIRCYNARALANHVADFTLLIL